MLLKSFLPLILIAAESAAFLLSAESAVCEMGQVCDEGSEEDCVIAGIAYVPAMMVCGGELCPAAVQTWEEINMKMHRGMMDIEYTGNPDIDFVRGMIPHHIGAVDMCKGLIETLSCTDIDADDILDGLIHFCWHVELEQELEVEGMRGWLAANGIAEFAPCSVEVESSRQVNNGGHMMEMEGATMDHMSEMNGMMNMASSCGNITSASSEKFIQLNEKMHDLMAVSLSCDHSVDFVRMMLPHHAGAVDMCDVLLETTADNYLIELCGNITVTQRAEIAWMYEWLEERNHDIRAICGSSSCGANDTIVPPCEDLLPISIFCEELGYCRCDEATFAAANFSCSETTLVEDIGTFEPAVSCARSCGQCLEEERTLWFPGCGMDHMDSGMDHMDSGMDHMDSGMDHMDTGTDHMDSGMDHMDSGTDHMDSVMDHMDTHGEQDIEWNDQDGNETHVHNSLDGEHDSHEEMDREDHVASTSASGSEYPNQVFGFVLCCSMLTSFL